MHVLLWVQGKTKHKPADEDVRYFLHLFAQEQG